MKSANSFEVNPYPGNVIINPNFAEGSTNWTIRTAVDGSAVIQNGRIEFTATAGVSSQLIVDTQQNIADGNYTVYAEVEHNQNGAITLNESIFTFPTGGTRTDDSWTGVGSKLVTGTVQFLSNGNLTVELQLNAATGLCYINSIYLVPQ